MIIVRCCAPAPQALSILIVVSRFKDLRMISKQPILQSHSIGYLKRGSTRILSIIHKSYPADLPILFTRSVLVMVVLISISFNVISPGKVEIGRLLDIPDPSYDLIRLRAQRPSDRDLFLVIIIWFHMKNRSGTAI